MSRDGKLKGTNDMEDNKKFELNDDALDEVAGGTDGGQPFYQGERVQYLAENKCPVCRTAWDISYAPKTHPEGIVDDCIDLGDHYVVDVRFECCGPPLSFFTGSNARRPIDQLRRI